MDITVIKVKQRGNNYILTVHISDNSDSDFSETKGNKIYCDKILVKLKGFLINLKECYIFIMFSKIVKDAEKYQIILKCNALEKHLNLNLNDEHWHVIGDATPIDELKEFDIELTINPLMIEAPFATLLDDQDLTDFKLQGEDGYVSVHKAVLAASSPVMLRMLSGAWKETTEGVIKVPGASKTTLDHFKTYLYLRTIPSTHIEQLLLLSVFYMMPDLETKCRWELINNLSNKNAYEVLEFAVKNNIKSFVMDLLQCISENIDLSVMKKHALSVNNIIDEDLSIDRLFVFEESK